MLKPSMLSPLVAKGEDQGKQHSSHSLNSDLPGLIDSHMHPWRSAFLCAGSCIAQMERTSRMEPKGCWPSS